MGERRKISPAAVVELADGAVVVGANAAAAAILGVTPAELIGRTIGLVDQRGQQSTGDVGNADVLDLFADLSALALFSQDADGRIVRWNRGAERIFGHSEDEIVGGTLPSLAPAHLRADLESVRQRVATGERVDRIFTEIQRKDGMRVPIALSVSPVVERSGAIVGAVGVAQELTESRLAQAALAEVEHRIGEWEALAHVGRWLWDVGTDAVQWSDELHRMHGVDPMEFDGTLDGHLAVVHPDDRDRVHSLMQAAVSNGQPFADEYRIGDGDATRWFATRAEPAIGSSGDVVGVRGVSQAVAISAFPR